MFYQLSLIAIGKKKHSHIGYINAEKQAAMTSFDAEHSHEITWVWDVPPQEAQTDEMGNEIAPAQPGQGRWAVSPGPDGHTHEIEGRVKAKAKQKKEEDSEVLAGMRDHFKECVDYESESWEKARESEEMFMGKQWADADKTSLTAQARACVTINLSQVEIDRLCGYQKEQRMDITYAPQEDGDEAVADIISQASKIILDGCYYQREKSKAFQDAAIVGRGWLELYLDRETNIRGDIKVKKLPWDAVRCGPHLQEDLSDCELLFTEYMASKQKLEQLYPDKAEDIKLDFDSYFNADPAMVNEPVGDKYELAKSMPMTIGGYPMVSTTRKEYRVIERWLKYYKEVFIAANPTDDVYELIEDWSPKDVAALKTIPGFTLIPRRIPRMRITTTAGCVILEDRNPADLAIQDFHHVPFYGHKRGPHFWGKMELVKDPQREVNRRHSQITDIINRNSAYGYFIDASTFPTPKEENHFKDISSTPGFVQKVTNQDRPPKKAEGGEFPGEIVNLLEFNSNRLIQLMNVTIESAGANESGSKFLQRQKSKLAGNEFLFDNVAFAEQKIGKILAAMIQKYMRPDRLFKMLQRSDGQTMDESGQPLQGISEEDIQRLLTDQDLTTYNVQVTESPNSPTAMIATNLMLTDMMQAGAPIPPDAWIMTSALPKAIKDRIQRSMAAQSQQAAQETQTQADSEVIKTAINQGIRSPKIDQALGISQPPDEPQQPNVEEQLQ